MANICTFNKDLEIIKPSNYILNYYYMLISCKSIGYLEYVLEFCKISIVFLIKIIKILINFSLKRIIWIIKLG